MTCAGERKALERLAVSWRKIITGARVSSPPVPPEGASPPPETPVRSPQAGPGAPSTPAG